jgi:hypothetical protein
MVYHEVAMKISLFAMALMILFVAHGDTQEAKKPPKLLEPASFWTAIANDAKLDPQQRALAIHWLFERHVKQGATLGKLAEVLGKQTWISEKDVERVGFVAGYVPLDVKFGDSLMCLVVFRNENTAKHNKEVIGIYLSIEGQIDRAAFLDTIKGKKTKHENTKLTAWSISPTWNECVERISAKLTEAAR